jgi:hypothetical protein
MNSAQKGKVCDFTDWFLIDDYSQHIFCIHINRRKKFNQRLSVSLQMNLQTKGYTILL